jgi:hypothetical protein
MRAWSQQDRKRRKASGGKTDPSEAFTRSLTTATQPARLAAMSLFTKTSSDEKSLRPMKIGSGPDPMILYSHSSDEWAWLT